MNSHGYPVRVDATLDSDLSRWLWLVKWLLAIPHYLVLAFLWAAFMVLSVVAWVAILVTGRYPRAIFDFNVGVLRWSWRVAFYAYGGLGTDRYPPFSLQDRPDYPAHLEIEYPEQLSRGLALVKWWLLAIPHYLVVGIFLGTGWYVATSGAQNSARLWSSGLIGLLVFVAAVVLLFTGRYPRGIFDLVLGLNRWVLRVAAYAGLMTDDYPPFRLDLGGTDPGTGVLTVGTATPPPPVAAPGGAPPAAGTTPGTAPVATPGTGAAPAPPAAGGPPASHWGAGRIIAVIIGSVLAFASLGLLAGGGVLRLADNGLRDSQGYLMSSAVEFTSPGYAATSGDVDLRSGTPVINLPERWLGTVKVEADARTANGVFIGIARTSDVESYLAGVAHSTVSDPFGSDRTPPSSYTAGTAPRGAPQDQSIWVASARGQGRQTLTWKSSAGSWTLVVMNDQGTRAVAADVSAGATVPVLDDIALGLLFAGLGGVAVSALVLVLALRRPRSGT